MRSAAVTTTALALVAAGAVLTASPAAAADGSESYAQARFLSGSVGGTDLDTLLELEGAEARNTGGAETVVDANPLDVTVLGSVAVPVGPVTVPLGDLVRLGAVNQYAEAAAKGVSRAAAGAVADSGGVSTTGSQQFPADASISLGALLDQAAPRALDGVIDDVSLDLRAISAVAALDAGRAGGPAVSCSDLSDPVQCRDYAVRGGDLVISAPALAALVDGLTGPGGVAAQVDAITAAATGPTGAITTALTGLLDDVGVVTGDVAVTTQVAAAVNAALADTLSDGVVTIDLSDGTITADLEALLGEQLDDLAPNTEIVTAALLGDLADRVAALLGQLPATLTTAITSALAAATLTADMNVCIGLGGICASNLSVTVDGTLAQVLAGTADVKLALSPLGTVPITGADVLGALAGALQSLMGQTATIPGLIQAAVSPVVAALEGALAALPGIVSLVANVQEQGSQERSYREVALRLTLLPAATPALRLDLAAAEVGPNVLAVATPGSPTPGGPGAPGTPNRPAPTLPNVGAQPVGLVAGGGVLLFLGGAVLMLRERRRLTVG